METKHQAIRKMEYQVATAARIPTPSRVDFMKWYRQTLDYKIKLLGIRLRFFLRWPK